MAEQLPVILDKLDLDPTVRQALLASSEKDQRSVFAAFDAYLEAKDMDDLTDSLERIAKRIMGKHAKEESVSGLRDLEDRVTEAERRDQDQADLVNQIESEVSRLSTLATH